MSDPSDMTVDYIGWERFSSNVTPAVTPADMLPRKRVGGTFGGDLSQSIYSTDLVIWYMGQRGFQVVLSF